MSAGLHTCGLTTLDAAYCWGWNTSGQLGDGSTTNSAVPVVVSTGLSFDSIVPGNHTTCGVTRSGAVYCWGSNGAGELGDGTQTDRATPVAVQGGLTFAAVSAGTGHICGVTTGGVAYCWGDDFYGQLGDGWTSGSFRTTPVAVQGGLTFAAVSAGYHHTCGVTTGGVAYCWGGDLYGQLGNGSQSYAQGMPVAVLSGRTFAMVSTGYSHTCGVTSVGAAYCWGYNREGQLGDGTTTGRTTPVAVEGGLTFAAVSAGWNHTCGVTIGGAVYCWGYNGEGEVGNGTKNYAQTTPVAVLGGFTFAAVRAGYYHTCGITSGGTAYCWDANFGGQLGNGTTTYSSVPVKVAGQPWPSAC